MNLEAQYSELYKNAVNRIKSGDCQVDTRIDDLSDIRRGITLLLRPNPEVKKSILKFLSILRVVDPAQYYYPDSDLHVTIMSIITCYDGFQLTDISTQEYVEMIRKSLVGISNFRLGFKGITASPAGVMAQGFLEDDTLTEMRDSLRAHFKASSLQQSIDQRYILQMAHSTLCRFRAPLVNVERFLEVLDAYRDVDFGDFEVSTVDFVFNDWYQRATHVSRLATFELRG